ncbi:phosphatase PAP2 family protein [Tumebacillus sp. ITR2]|uniref:Phosphatase PAP2 family protein n=1 Tax=Tumebacillus amylolyticus TaxID=2801339 RepID=A0ABS1JG55_9BACL|nr:phosphatase PAP2 family protein [Tumebacillus amylolyticus]MBL0388984.1 phosphatase PAP2 family protein [Tumebacillus amylolyticus]
MDWDVLVYHFFNQFAGHVPVLDWFFSKIAEYSLEMYAVLFVMAWFTLPKQEVGKRHGLLLAGVAGVLALLINFVISHVWYRPRPFVTLPEGTYTKLIPHDPDASFPSDHTSGSFGFAFGSADRTANWVSRSFAILAVLVMISRVYCGVHYPTDVLASVIVGFIASRISWKLSGRLVPLTRRICQVFGYGK